MTAIWKRAEALGLSRRNGWSLLYWASCTEGKESYQGQDMEEGWETETHGERGKEKIVEVSEKTLEQSFDWECHSFGEYWDSPDCRSQIQEVNQHLLKRWDRAIAL